MWWISLGNRGPRPTVNPEIVVAAAIQAVKENRQLKTLAGEIGLSRQRIYQVLEQTGSMGLFKSVRKESGPPIREKKSRKVGVA